LLSWLLSFFLPWHKDSPSDAGCWTPEPPPECARSVSSPHYMG
jgi:hypothetical protein